VHKKASALLYSLGIKLKRSCKLRLVRRLMNTISLPVPAGSMHGALLYQHEWVICLCQPQFLPWNVEIKKRT
jgi:hypothetical protein